VHAADLPWGCKRGKEEEEEKEKERTRLLDEFPYCKVYGLQERDTV
jgi:hypothetical protein